jgi:hypothetical protein
MPIAPVPAPDFPKELSTLLAKIPFPEVVSPREIATIAAEIPFPSAVSPKEFVTMVASIAFLAAIEIVLNALRQPAANGPSGRSNYSNRTFRVTLSLETRSSR